MFRLRNDIFFYSKFLCVVLSYTFLGLLGLTLEAEDSFATLIWAPSGIALAVLLLGGYRYWPAIALGSALVNTSIGAPWPATAGIAVGSTLQPIFGTWILRRFNFRPSFPTFRDVIKLLVGGCMICTLISPSIGVSSLFLANIIMPHRVLHAWITWWLGDMLGILIVSPLIWVWADAWDRTPRRASSSISIEFAAFSAFVALIACVVFFWTSDYLRLG